MKSKRAEQVLHNPRGFFVLCACIAAFLMSCVSPPSEQPESGQGHAIQTQGSGEATANLSVEQSQLSEASSVLSFPFALEAEDLPGIRITSPGSVPEGYSGRGSYALKPGAEGRLVFWVSVPQTKMYELKLGIAAESETQLEVFVSGERMERVRLQAVEGYYQLSVPPIFLEEGSTELGLGARGSEIYLDSIELKESLTVLGLEIDPRPTNPNASPAVWKVLRYLAEGYGKGILAGQQDLTWDDKIDMKQRVFSITGKYPALMGYDFMNYKGSLDGGSGRQQVEEAIEHWKQGGLVTFCWHWRVGSSNEFYTGRTNFRIPNDVQSSEYQSLIADIDSIALQLKRLQDAGVPVLWRPLHEASGGWFWWGASGARPQIQLWRFMYERMTKVHGLNNLIWVWNGQHEAWYPGDDVVDIIGMDIYGQAGTSLAYRDSWVMAQGMVDGENPKLVALTENGPIPDPEKLISEEVPWSWFLTWNDGNSNNPDQDFWSSEKIMSSTFKRKVYQHGYVITLDELPNFKN